MKTVTLEKKAVTGKTVHPAELIQRIQKGLRFSELKTLQDTLELPFEKLAAKLCISRLLTHATSVFGDLERARTWLKHPQVGLGGAIPLDYASTEAGAREVENWLERIEYSVY